MMKRLFLILAIFTVFGQMARAQELNCQVDVIYPQIQGVNTAIFDQMKQDVFEFMNNRKWTNDKFTIEERIKCNLLINITDARASSNTYKAELQIVSTRPVFNSSYESAVLNVRDDAVTFEYFQNTQYNFNPDNFQNNLVSILAYYAYMVIGYDYDTYSPSGGTPYYQQAQRIVQSAQGSNYPGWKAFESDKNRYWLVEDILHKTFEPLRATLYQYHREGLDIMSDKTQLGRQKIMASLQGFNQIHRIKPMAYVTQLFFLAKSDEIGNIFKEAPVPERNTVYETLSKVDPGNLAKYEKMQKGK
ncbi:DUF4835 family protein [Cryomorpha ignava]|uniref:DUF4835 family protein n=1 Tax=Cryomorpha ignava TaxID=101383 RepID=A0A7K3WV22_9FLAO|nr:DUF4835 family protein [Cryomorpha ignava]NEN25500.1 DUF4835 family protein [Cryomorpha ignava]